MLLDDIDKHLIVLVQKDSKQTNKELSNKLDLSVTAVYERIKKMERLGIIERYTAMVNQDIIGKNFIAYCHIKLIQHSKDYVTKFEKEIIKLSEVLECYHVSGDYDYILKIVVENINSYREFMVNKLTAISHIGSTHTTFVMSKVKHSTVLSL